MKKVEKDCISYDELLEVVKKYKLKKRYDVVCYLIGYCKAVTMTEYEQIQKLADEGLLED